MFASDIFKLAFKALRDRKLRSFLTILGIMIGSAIILALIASSSGLSAGVQGQVSKIGANTLTVSSARQFFGSSSGGGAQGYQLSQQDVSTIKSFQGVSDVIPYYSQRATVSYGSNSIEDAELIGLDTSALSTMYKGLSLYSGSMPDPYDPSAAAVGYSIAFPTGSSDQLTLNQMISITLGGSSSGSLTFLVRGVFSAYGSVLFSNIDDTIFISLQSAQILLKTQYFSGLYVITNTAGDVTTVQQEIETYYGTQVRVMNAGSMVSSVESITSQMTVFLGSIGAVSLFVAAVGITNTMFVSVMERTREIGIMKALGYKPKQIMGLFLSEAALSGVVGGVGGTILGYVLSFMIGGSLSGFSGFGMGGGPPGQTSSTSASSTSFTPVFTPELIAFSLLFPIGIAVLAGLYPAWRASRMNAVVALKYE
ncbi:MAG: FtsX-like permease family protein [Candidatus Bathyarchaeia archaeon]|jgi:putative ABC transport system permease protein